MLNHVLEAVLALMVALLALSISVIVRVRPTAPSTTMDSEQAMPGEPMITGNGFGHPNLAGAGQGQALWAMAPPGVPAGPGSAQRRPGLLGKRYEARHVRGRTVDPRRPGPAGPPWGPAAPPPQQGSEHWN